MNFALALQADFFLNGAYRVFERSFSYITICNCILQWMHYITLCNYIYITIQSQNYYNYKLIGCWSFMSWQHLTSYQDMHRLVTVHTHGDFRLHPPLADQATSFMTRYSIQSQYLDTESPSPSFPILIMLSAWLERDKHKCVIH